MRVSRPRRQLGQAEARQPERRPDLRARPRTKSSAAPRVAPTTSTSVAGRKLPKEGTRGVEPGRGGCRSDDTKHYLHAFFRTPCRTLGYRGACRSERWRYSNGMLAILTLIFVLGGQTGASLSAFENRIAADPENLKIAADYRQAVIASGDYDRAIKFFEALDQRQGAGPHAALNLGLAYIDKIPAVGSFRRISLGNNATTALTRSIQRKPSDVAYSIRGMVNLHFEKGFFHRTPEGVADLEARDAARVHAPGSQVPS